MNKSEGSLTVATPLERMMDTKPSSDEANYVLSYKGLRKAIGIIGIALPISLLIGKPIVDGGGMLGSISAYYYSEMRNYFVGTMCALAVFFFSYKYARRDNFLSTLTSIFALGVAFFPTTPRGADTTWTAWLHFTCAVLFFLTLAYFAYFIFTLPPLPKEQREPRKRLRNNIYRICGVTIAVSLILSPILDRVLSVAVRAQIHPLFWLESIAVWAFSVSWLVKGDFIPWLSDTLPASKTAADPR
jgi:hypothetical protein